MSDDPMNGFGKWLHRVQEAANVVNAVGVSGVLLVMLILVGLTYYGYLHSPYSDLPADFKAHDAHMVGIIAERQKIDVELLSAIQAMRTEMVRNSAAYRLRTCADISSADVRRKCMEQ